MCHQFTLFVSLQQQTFEGTLIVSTQENTKKRDQCILSLLISKNQFPIFNTKIINWKLFWHQNETSKRKNPIIICWKSKIQMVFLPNSTCQIASIQISSFDKIIKNALCSKLLLNTVIQSLKAQFSVQILTTHVNCTFPDQYVWMEVQQNIVSNPITDIVPGQTEHNAFGCCAK
jgi:hypothetical protein